MANMLGRMKKTMALLLSLVLLMAELVLPAAALASDITALPALTISYTDAYGTTGMVTSSPVEGTEEILYWVQIVDPVTYPLQISAWVEGDATFYDLFMNGTLLENMTYEVLQDTAAPDVISAVATLNVYEDAEHTVWLASYPVYLSTQIFPTEEPDVPPTDVIVPPEVDPVPPEDDPIPPVDEPVDPPVIEPEPTGPESFGVYTDLGDIEGYVFTENGGPLNMRKTPNKDYEAIASIPFEASIIIHGLLDNGWYYIQYNGSDGYVSSDYVKQGNPVPVPTSADVTFYYVDADGESLKDAATKSYDNGSYSDFSDMIASIEGYNYLSISADSLVVDAGVASPASITITYEAIPVPTSADVTFYYVDADGESIKDAATKSYDNGSYSDFSDMIASIEGYNYLSISADSLVVDAGVASPASITITYEAIPVPTSADVTFYYVDADGESIKDAATKSYDNGTYSDFSDMIASIEGYNYLSISSDSLVVDAGVASPASITVTYEAIPVPTSADVTFYYVDADGESLKDAATKSYDNGTYSDFSDMIASIEGYNYLSISTDSLVVDAGVASPASITVTYEAIPVPTSADVTFYYVDADGESIKDAATKTYDNGTYSDFSDMIATIEGYNYLSISADSLVVDAGVASPASITVTYEAIPVPTSADVTFYYVDADGESIKDAATKSYDNGTYSDFSDMIATIDGYNYLSISADSLTVADGVATPASITVTYEAIPAAPPAPTSADVTFYYVDADGESLKDAATKSYDNGTYSDFSDMIATIEGYNYLSISADSLTVADGVATPASITVTYEAIPAAPPAPTSADVTFYYVDADGESLKDAATKSYDNGTYSDFSDMVPTIDGYDFISISAESLTVADGVATPASITVTYAVKAPSSADVTFKYVDAEGNELYPSAVKSYNNGSYTDFSDMIPALTGYEVQSISASALKVEAGVATPSTITITYKKPVTASVNVRYLVDDVEFISETVTLKVGTVTIAPDSSLIPDGYTPVSVTPVKVTLKEDGTLSHTEVIFTYETVIAPTSANVTLLYKDEKGKVLKQIVVTLEEGHYSDINEYISKFDGYSYQSASADGIVVSGGVAVPDTITFNYLKNTTAVLEVRYVDPIGQVLSTETLSLKPGSHKISPNPSMIPEGYKLSSSGNTLPTLVTVENTANLVAKPNMIEFRLVSTSVRAKVNVNYMTTAGKVVATAKLELEPGVHTLTPDTSKLPSGYEIISNPAQKQQITVSDTGTANLSTVTFYCKEKASSQYIGYAITTSQVSLRNAYNMKDTSILATLPAKTLLFVNGQATVSNVLWSSAQTVLGTKFSGVLPDSSIRHISDAEANAIIAKWNEQNPTPTPSPTPAPTLIGYYKTTTSTIVLRSQPSVYASYTQLPENGVIYISGEGNMNGAKWYTVNYNGTAGYIRADQAAMLKKMTQQEIDQYLGNNPDPTPTATVMPYDPYGKSSYGYVTSSSVNFRETPSTSGKRLKILYRYAFGLIIGSKEVNGATWYYINQNGTTGWVHGNYFRQLNLTELNSFLVSDEYQQGIANNSSSSTTTGSSTSTSTTGGTTGSATPGNIASVEDWNVGAWENTGVASPSYQPFNPYATATPAPTLSPDEELEPGDYTSSTLLKLYESTSKSSTITPVPANTQLTIREKRTANNAEWYLVSYNGRLLYLEADAASSLELADNAAPTASIDPIFTMIPIDYDPEEISTNSTPWGLIIGGVILLGGAGAVYAYALNQNKKRKAAARRNAAGHKPSDNMTRRAVSAPTVSSTPNPYAAGKPQTNPYGTQQIPSTGDNQYGTDSRRNPYAPPVERTMNEGYSPAVSQAPEVKNPYAPPADSAAPNSFAPPADSSPVSGSAQRSNPYARPVETPSFENSDETVRRRSTRRERYHSADDGNDNTQA